MDSLSLSPLLPQAVNSQNPIGGSIAPPRGLESNTDGATDKRKEGKAQPAVIPLQGIPVFSDISLVYMPATASLGTWFRTQTGIPEQPIEESALQAFGRELLGEPDENSKQLLQEIENLWLLSRGLRLMMNSVVGA